MMIQRLSQLVFWLIIIVILFLATTPKPVGPVEPFIGLDKILHIFAFFVLAWVVNTAYPHHPLWQKLFGLFCYGLMIEIIQKFMPPREFSLYDLLADVIGMLFYLALSNYCQQLIDYIDHKIERLIFR